MAKTNNLTDFLTDVADAIRTKKGTTGTINPQDFSTEIASISTGKEEIELTATPTASQQVFTPDEGKVYSKVTVQAVPQETKTVTPTASAQNVTPSSGKFLSRVTVNAVPSESKTVTPTKSVQTVSPSSGKWLSSVTVNAIPSEYIIPSGTQQIVENGTYDVSGKASAVVNVPSGVEEVATASAMDALLVEANVGKYYKFTGTTDSNYINGDLYLVESGGSSVGGTVVFNITHEANILYRRYFRIYDGTDTSGALLYEIADTTTSIPSPLTVNCSSGHLFISVATQGNMYCTADNPTGGVTVQDSVFYVRLTITVTSDGTIDLFIDYDI